MVWGQQTRKWLHVSIQGSYLYNLLVQRVHLDISIGEHAIDYAQIAAKEKLNEIQLRVRQLLDQIEQITKEQAYQRVHYHNKRCVSMSIVVTVFRLERRGLGK